MDRKVKRQSIVFVFLLGILLLGDILTAGLAIGSIPVDAGLKVASGAVTCVIPRDVSSSPCTVSFPAGYFKNPPLFYLLESHPALANETEIIPVTGNFTTSIGTEVGGNRTETLTNPNAVFYAALGVQFASDNTGACTASSGSFLQAQWSNWTLIQVGPVFLPGWYNFGPSVKLDCSSGIAQVGNSNSFFYPETLCNAAPIDVAFSCWNNSTIATIHQNQAWYGGGSLAANLVGHPNPILIRFITGGGSGSLVIESMSLLLLRRVFAHFTIQILTAASSFFTLDFPGGLSSANTQTWNANWFAIDPACNAGSTVPGMNNQVLCTSHT